MFNKGLSNHFQISHTISMSSIAQSGYRYDYNCCIIMKLNARRIKSIWLKTIDTNNLDLEQRTSVLNK